MTDYFCDRLSEEMMKDCDTAYLEGVGNECELAQQPKPQTIDDFYQVMDEIKFLRTKLSEKDREIDFLKQDLNRTIPQRQASQSMEIQVLRKKSKDDSKEIVQLKYENDDLQNSLICSMEEIASLRRQVKDLKNVNNNCLVELPKKEQEQEQVNPSRRQQITVVQPVTTSEEQLDTLTKKNKDMAEDVTRLKTMLQKQTNNLIAANREKEDLKKSKEELLNESKVLKFEAEQRSRDLNTSKFEIEHLKECKGNLLQELQRFKTTGVGEGRSSATAYSHTSGNGIFHQNTCRTDQKYPPNNYKRPQLFHKKPFTVRPPSWSNRSK